MLTTAQKEGYIKRSKNKSWLAARHHVASIAAKALQKYHKETFLAGRRKTSKKLRAYWRGPDNDKLRQVHSAATRKGYTPKVRAQMSASAKARVARLGCNWRFNRIGAFEKVLYFELHIRGFDIRRQYAIPNTRCKGDLYWPKKNLVIEIDLHQSHYTTLGRQQTKIRDRRVRAQGLRIVHITQGDKSKGIHHCIRKIERY